MRRASQQRCGCRKPEAIYRVVSELLVVSRAVSVCLAPRASDQEHTYCCGGLRESILRHGMLGLIKADHIIEALQSLLPAELANADTIDVEHAVPEVGRVRFTARRKL